MKRLLLDISSLLSCFGDQRQFLFFLKTGVLRDRLIPLVWSVDYTFLINHRSSFPLFVVVVVVVVSSGNFKGKVVVELRDDKCT